VAIRADRAFWRYRECPAFGSAAAMLMKAIMRNEIAPQRDEGLHFTG
jgi:hypothetical protein